MAADLAAAAEGVGKDNYELRINNYELEKKIETKDFFIPGNNRGFYR